MRLLLGCRPTRWACVFCLGAVAVEGVAAAPLPVGRDRRESPPLTAAFESDAATLDDIVAEMLTARTSERSGRLIDHDESGSMEKKKREGYF